MSTVDTAEELKLKIHKTRNILQKERRMGSKEVEKLKDKTLYYQYENKRLELGDEGKLRRLKVSKKVRAE